MFRCIMYVLRYKSAGAYLYFGGSKKANRRSIAEKETLRPFQWKVGKCATLIIMGTRYFVPISSDAKQIQRMSASVVRGGGGRHRPIRLFVQNFRGPTGWNCLDRRVQAWRCCGGGYEYTQVVNISGNVTGNSSADGDTSLVGGLAR